MSGSADMAHESARHTRSALRRVALKAIGNVFLGMAIGLLAYYGLTDMIGRASQAQLDSELKDLGSIGDDEPAAALPDDPEGRFDWTGWAEQDKAYWESLADGGVFGRILIERIGLDVAVLKGHSRANLKRGPGWVDYTDLPSRDGNVGISGHRTTYGAPFRNIDRLVPGDTIDVYSPYRRYRYRVIEVFTVTPDRTDVFDRVDRPRLTLTACHPPYSARYRIVVWAELSDVRRFEAPPHVMQ